MSIKDPEEYATLRQEMLERFERIHDTAKHGTGAYLAFLAFYYTDPSNSRTGNATSGSVGESASHIVIVWNDDMRPTLAKRMAISGVRGGSNGHSMGTFRVDIPLTGGLRRRPIKPILF